jgi:uncharacterized protein (TIGR04255 family)
MSRYNNNYLTHVIAKTNFNEIPSIDKELPKEITKMVSSNFPLFEPKPHSFQEIVFSESGAKVVKSLASTDWFFHGLNREKVLKISRDVGQRGQMALIVDYSKYESFDKLKGEFIPLFNVMAEFFPISKIELLGLRYVNKIGLSERNPLNWSRYINSNLTGSLKFIKGGNFISRAFNNLELKYDDMNIRFQYGMHNPDYPSIIKKKEFILDYDAYLSREQDISEIPRSLERYHDAIELLFENSIKDDLRDKMNE